MPRPKRYVRARKVVTYEHTWGEEAVALRALRRAEEDLLKALRREHPDKEIKAETKKCRGT